jgi:hypothetical protein
MAAILAGDEQPTTLARLALAWRLGVALLIACSAVAPARAAAGGAPVI